MKEIITAVLLSILMCLLSVMPAFATDNSTDSVQIKDRSGLEAIVKNPSGKYVLMADIDMKGADWKPIAFSGTFDGNGHTIYNLSIKSVGNEVEKTVDGNDKVYDTYFASLFSTAKNAEIKNLTLLNVNVNVSTDNNCFAAGLVGYAENTKISGCSVSGRINLVTPSKMCGVAGIIGFGYGSVSNTNADVTLVFVDNDLKVKCEQFMGGIISCGYGQIENCSVKLAGYGSVQGYVHDGGIIGMYHVHTNDNNYKSYINNTKINGAINFYENNTDRRAYCRDFIGELLGVNMSQTNNTTERFERNETLDYSKVLLPEKCENPQYTKTVTAPDCTKFGYTTYTCPTCGYSYTDDYIAPAHKAGEYKIVREPSNDKKGLKVSICTACGKELDEIEFCTFMFAKNDVRIDKGKTSQLNVTSFPVGEKGHDVVWKSSDEKVAVVDNQGNVKAVGLGKAVITYSSSDSLTALNCTVTVQLALWVWIIIAIGAIVIICVAIFIIRKRKSKSKNNKKYYKKLR